MLENSDLPNHRFPLQCVKSMTRQLFTTIEYLHSHQIGHGDVHARNTVLRDADAETLSESELINRLGSPELREVARIDGQPLDDGVPAYLVWPATLESSASALKTPDIRLVDFGEASTADDKPETLRTPLVMRAPEVLSEDQWDYRVDLWSAGCMVFEVLTGQPPFDTIMIIKERLVAQMVGSLGPLLESWKDKQSAGNDSHTDGNTTLEEWLLEVYFEEGKTAEMSRSKVEAWGNIMRKLLQFEPERRLPANGMLQEPLLN